MSLTRALRIPIRPTPALLLLVFTVLCFSGWLSFFDIVVVEAVEAPPRPSDVAAATAATAAADALEEKPATAATADGDASASSSPAEELSTRAKGSLFGERTLLNVTHAMQLFEQAAAIGDAYAQAALGFGWLSRVTRSNSSQVSNYHPR